MDITIQEIFKVKSEEDFNLLALKIFRFQAKYNKVYSDYLNALNVNPDKVLEISHIPFLPVEFFKSHQVISSEKEETKSEFVFRSSGTTGRQQSKHYVSDISIYEKSFLYGFEQFYGNIEEYCILAFLPSYLERKGSSLIYMADKLIGLSRNLDSGFYLNNYHELDEMLERLKEKSQKTLLLGVTYALLDIADMGITVGKNCTVMETGGMKGKREEMIRDELHEYLCNKLGVKFIHSEYGMTEMLSQAYSKGDGVFQSPPWLKILIRDINDPFCLLQNNKSGGVNIIDLANLYSCSFISTMDIGKTLTNGTFEVLGRFDNSDIRGCNLLME